MREHFIPIQLNPRDEALFRIHNCGNCKGFESLIRDGRVLEEGYVIQLITKGRGVFASEPSNFETFEGETLILSRPGVWQAFGPQPGTAMDHTYVHFSGQLPSVLLEELNGQGRDIISMKVSRLYRRTFSNICRLVQLKSRKEVHQAHALTYELIIETISLFHHQLPASSRPIIDEFMTYLSKQLHALELDLEGFLKPRDFTRAKFCRLLKQESGSTPHQLWLDYKIGEAQSLLIRSELSVKEIAKAMGFQDEFYFSRLFKKKQGVSPTQYRQKF
jgi:AraC-like DNA-binding protein